MYKFPSVADEAPGESMKPKCPDCNDEGVRDSGGAHPWGEPIFIPCDHNEQPGMN